MFGMTLDELCINTIRMLAVDAVEAAKSGHPGLPMGAAPMAYVLWTHFLKHNPKDPDWPDRDRFVLSAGHGSMLLYALLYLTGYPMPLEEIRRFRQWGSITAGHPESELAPGIETTTGPLGQGFGNAVGMAIAERHLAARFNVEGHRVVDHRTYVLASDGDMMEGVASEAASLAGHLGLGKLIVLYDDNGTTIEGKTALAFSENVPGRFDAYGWHTQRVEDGTDLAAIDAAIEHAIVEESRPSLISVRTLIGHGNPKREGTARAHSDPFGPEEVRLTSPPSWSPNPCWRTSGRRSTTARRRRSAGTRTFGASGATFPSWRAPSTPRTSASCPPAGARRSRGSSPAIPSSPRARPRARC
jgi:transketolase